MANNNALTCHWYNAALCSLEPDKTCSQEKREACWKILWANEFPVPGLDQKMPREKALRLAKELNDLEEKERQATLGRYYEDLKHLWGPRPDAAYSVQ